MSIKLSTAQQLQNLKEQIKNLDKSLVEETKKFKTSMSDLIDKGIIDQLNVDLPFNSTAGEAINDIVLSKIEYSSGNSFGFSMEFDTAEYSPDGAKTGVLPKQNDGEILIINNSDYEDFTIPPNDFSEYDFINQNIQRAFFEAVYKNRFVLIWGSGSISRKEIRNAIIKSKYFRKRSWVICDYKKSDGNLFEYKDVLKKLQKYYPAGWIFSSIGIGNGCAPALKNLGDINYDSTEDSNVKNYTGYFFSISNTPKRLSGNLYKKNILATVGFIFPTFPEGDTWAGSIKTSTYIPDDSGKRNLIIRTNTKEIEKLNLPKYNSRFERINNIYNPGSTPIKKEIDIFSPAILSKLSYIESLWDTTAVSDRGAAGISQFTGDGLDGYNNLNPDKQYTLNDRNNIYKSYDMLVWKINNLYNQDWVQNPGSYNGGPYPFKVKLAKVVGAYNSGEGTMINRLTALINSSPPVDVNSNLDWVKKIGGDSYKRETRTHIQKFFPDMEITGLSEESKRNADSIQKEYDEIIKQQNARSGPLYNKHKKVIELFWGDENMRDVNDQDYSPLSSSPSESTESSEKAVTFSRLKYTGNTVETRLCVQDLQNVEFGDKTIITQFIDDYYMEF